MLPFRKYSCVLQSLILCQPENQQTENVPSLRSNKAPPCAAYAAIPCVLTVRKQHKILFAASK